MNQLVDERCQGNDSARGKVDDVQSREGSLSIQPIGYIRWDGGDGNFNPA
jgi:hypothetical protein